MPDCTSPRPGTIGRPRVKGARLPSLAQRLKDPATAWRRVRITGWYGRTERHLDIVSGTALWHHPGKQVAIRWVLVRDPTGEHEPAAFLSTDLTATPAMILGWFVSRWRVETTFQEVRTHLGVETQRQWSDRAILRTTPVLLGLFSLITLWADDLARNTATALPLNATAWYRKHKPTFSDAIAAVRRMLWCPPNYAISRTSAETVQMPAALLNRVFQTLCLAA